MKQKNLSVLKIVVVVLIVEIVLSGLYYLLVYDKNKPAVYPPQLSSWFLEKQIKTVEPMAENAYGEIIIDQKDFEGIFGYNFAKDGTYEIEHYIKYLDWGVARHTHIVFSDDSYEIYVGDVTYTDILNAWQYDWWDRQGNQYADIKGDDEAEGKPNYRYHYRFLIRKNNDLYAMEMFCNNDDAEKVLSVCVEKMNEL